MIVIYFLDSNLFSLIMVRILFWFIMSNRARLIEHGPYFNESFITIDEVIQMGMKRNINTRG
jgi:hypothetical protein